jgi:hypothetical protein
MKRYYSAESAHGSESSYGFCNDTVVRAFSSKAARDDYVLRSRNISCKTIRAHEATREATNWNLTQNRTNAPRPFSGEFWAIIPPYYDEDTRGLIGYVSPASPYDVIISRFYS